MEGNTDRRIDDASIAEEEAVLERRHDETMVPRPTNGDNGRFRHESAKRSQPCVTHDKANDRLLKENMESLAKTKHTRRIIPGSFPDEDGE
jgi:DNA-directed RNA polymerase beta subunit